MRSWRLLVLVVVVLVLAGDVAQAHDVDPASYRWVRPPDERAEGHGAPEGRRAQLPAGSPVDSFWTPDLQLVLSWPSGALGDAATTIEVQPLDPTDLGPLPRGRLPDGNAYRIELAPAERLLSTGDVRLRVPYAASAVYHSTDGRAWEEMVERRDEAGVTVAAFGAEGYVLAAWSVETTPAWRRAAPYVTWCMLVIGSAVLGAQELARRRRRSARALAVHPNQR